MEPIPLEEGGALVPALRRRLETEETWLATLPGFSTEARAALVAWLARRFLALARGCLTSASAAPSPEVFESALRVFPVLARLCGLSRDGWRRHCHALASRLARDLGEPAAALEILGSAAALPPSAIGLTLASGRRIVYRTRDQRIGAWFIELCRELNERGLRAPLHLRRVEPRAGYAWDERVEPAPCEGPDAVRAYFVRVGELARLLSLLRAVDMHRRNVVAAGEHPVIVDFDGLFRPMAPERSSLERTPFSTGLLPMWVTGERGRPALNGGGIQLGGGVQPFAREDGGAKRYKPETSPATAPASPYTHRQDILDGYDAMEELLGRVDLRPRMEAAASLPVRAFPRPVIVHRMALARSVVPELLRSEAARDAYLAAAIPEGPVADVERASLRHGLIPVFGSLPGDDGIVLPDGTVRPGVFPGKALGHLRWQVDRVRDHETIVTALAVTEEPPAAPVASTPRALDWLVAARELGEILIHADVGVGWVPWAGVRRLAPLPPDLLSGHAGLAIVLARLFVATGEPRWREAALRALAPVSIAVLQKPRWYGAFVGLAGQLHALRVCGELLGDGVASALATRRIAALRDEAPAAATSDDLAAGLAGLALCCREPWLAELLEERRRIGLRAPPFLPGGSPDEVPGLEDGVTWALARLHGQPAPSTPRDELLRRAEAIAGDHAATGSWLPRARVADRLNPSAVTGLGAVALLFVRVATGAPALLDD